jgi:hypothetical protein
MPRTSYDLDVDPAKLSHDRVDAGDRASELDPDDEIIELDRRVTRSSEEAEEAELAEEDILDIADLEDERDSQKGEGPDA